MLRGTTGERARFGMTVGFAAVALAAATVAVAPPASAAEPRTGGFSALSYNVAGLPALISGSDPEINMTQISPKLNAYDVVLTQEDWADPTPPIEGVDFYHDDLLSQATHPFLSPPAVAPLGNDPRRPDSLIGDGLNYLSRLEIGPVYRQMWPGCFGGIDQSDGGAADCLSQKGFAVTRMVIGDGLTIDLYDLHAEAGSTPADNQWSAADFVVLAEFINTYSVGQAVIVAGDYNLSTSQQPDKGVFDTFIAATGLTDVCTVLDCGDDDHRIDKFVFKDGAVVDLAPTTHNFEVDVFTREADGAPLSDHDALRVDWTWSAPALGEAAPMNAVPFPFPAAPVPPTTPPVVAPIVTPRFTG